MITTSTPPAFPHLLILVLALALGPASRAERSPWINEFHYDNTGTDNQEFVEVAVPHSVTDLAGLRITLYNGGDGRTYGTSHLLNSFTAGESLGDFTLYSKSIPGLQNGAPDGLALDLGGSVVHFVSYEGSFAATAGPATGLFSSDVGLGEGETTPPGASLGLTGHGASPMDFVWESLPTATPGAANLGQFIVPEPSPSTLLITFGLAGWLAHRRAIPSKPSRRRILNRQT